MAAVGSARGRWHPGNAQATVSIMPSTYHTTRNAQRNMELVRFSEVSARSHTEPPARPGPVSTSGPGPRGRSWRVGVGEVVEEAVALGGLLAGGAGAGGGEHVAAQLVAEAQDLRDGQPLLEAGELEHL